MSIVATISNNYTKSFNKFNLNSLSNNVTFKDFSIGGSSWAKFHVEKRTVASAFSKSNIPYVAKQASHMLTCSSHVQYAVAPSGQARSFATIRCHNKFCPVCAFRNTLKQTTIIPQAIQKLASTKIERVDNILFKDADGKPDVLTETTLVNKYKVIKTYFLTLTLPNCPVAHVASHLDRMNNAWKKLLDRKFFKENVISFVRSTEFTFNKKSENDCHPHFHIILLASTDLEQQFKLFHGGTAHTVSPVNLKTYLAQEWEDALDMGISVDAQDLQELPFVTIEDGEQADDDKTNKELNNKLRYLCKYVVKGQTITENAKWASELMFNTRRRRMITLGQELNARIEKVEKKQLQPDEMLVSGLAVTIKRTLKGYGTSIVTSANPVLASDAEETKLQKQTGQSLHQAIKNGWLRCLYETVDFKPQAWVEAIDYVLQSQYGLPEFGHLSGPIIHDWMNTTVYSDEKICDELFYFIDNLKLLMEQTGLKPWECVGFPHPEITIELNDDQKDGLQYIRNSFGVIQRAYNQSLFSNYFDGTLTQKEVLDELEQFDLQIMRKEEFLKSPIASQAQKEEARFALKSLKYRRNHNIQKLIGTARNGSRERFGAVAVLHQAPYTALDTNHAVFLPEGTLYSYELVMLPAKQEPVLASLANRIAYPFLPMTADLHDWSKCYGDYFITGEKAEEEAQGKAQAQADAIAYKARSKAQKWSRLGYGFSGLNTKDDSIEFAGLVPTSPFCDEAELAFAGIKNASFDRIALALFDEQAIRAKVGNIKLAIFNEKNEQRIKKGLKPEPMPVHGLTLQSPEHMSFAVHEFNGQQALILNASRALRNETYSVAVTAIDAQSPFTGWAYKAHSGADFKAWHRNRNQTFDGQWFASRALQITVTVTVDGRSQSLRFAVPRTQAKEWQALLGRTLAVVPASAKQTRHWLDMATSPPG